MSTLAAAAPSNGRGLTMNMHLGNRWRRSVACMAFPFCVPPAVPLSVEGQAARQFPDRPVIEVLRQLQAEGQPIVFSSTLAPSDLRVTREPQANEPRAIALEILAPHGLTLKDGPRKTWHVARASRPRNEQEPEPQTERKTIRIEEHVVRN
jgi:hypothetical protein